jgi:hypothetical protein
VPSTSQTPPFCYQIRILAPQPIHPYNINTLLYLASDWLPVRGSVWLSADEDAVVWHYYDILLESFTSDFEFPDSLSDRYPAELYSTCYRFDMPDKYSRFLGTLISLPFSNLCPLAFFNSDSTSQPSRKPPISSSTAWRLSSAS